MKPRTKLERKIVELSEKLQPITPEQVAYAYKHCFAPIAFRTKKATHCLECGGSFLTDNTITHCPLCGVKLNYSDTRKQKDSQTEYFCIVNKASDMLVLRMFIVHKHLRVKSVPYHLIVEVVQNWFTLNGSEKIMARKLRFMSNNPDDWDLSSKIEIRSPQNRFVYYSADKYMIHPIAIYPHKCTLPLLKRNGFKGNFHGIAPVRFINHLIHDTQFETLLKARQYALLKRAHTHIPLIIWNAMKICIRNNYIVKDEVIWWDYIDMLITSGKDTHNAKYVCPANLRKEHDKLVTKRRAIEERERAERNRIHYEQNLKDIAQAEEEYQKHKKQFFDILISDGELEISPLKTVEEFKRESDILKHCVFTSSYYKKRDSLILSAHKGDKKLETIEVSLRDMRIVQCQGPHNKNTPYHNQIINLITKNIHQIQQRSQKQ